MSGPGPLSRLFEAMEDALCVIGILDPDADGVVRRVRYLHANAAFERHTGVANVEGRTSDDAFPGLEQHWFDHFARVWRTGKPVRVVDAADSLGRVYEVSLSRIGTADTRHVACLFRDVTMQHAAQQRALQMAAGLSENDRRKTEFPAALAHELRNPLAPIGNGLDLVEAIEGVPADAVRLHAMMSRQVSQLARLVDDLLDLSRISQDKIELQRVPASLASIVDDAVAACRPMLEHKGHELVVHVPPGDVRVDVDPVRLTQVLSNLLGNAVRYTPPNGHIEVRAAADDGDGMSEEDLERAFEMFTQIRGDVPTEHGGLGIGLTLSRRLVELHGGRLTARSPGRGLGSRFEVRVPHVGASGPDAGSSASPPPAPPMRILIVDDNRDAADTLARILTLKGHQTRVAYTGRDAIGTSDEMRPEVAFLDIDRAAGHHRLPGRARARRARLPGRADAGRADGLGHGQGPRAQPRRRARAPPDEAGVGADGARTAGPDRGRSRRRLTIGPGPGRRRPASGLQSASAGVDRPPMTKRSPPLDGDAPVPVLFLSILILAGCGSGAGSGGTDVPPQPPAASALPGTPAPTATSPAAPRSYDYPDHPYAEIALRAAERYAGAVDAASIDVDNAGPLLSALLYGPMADLTQHPGTVPEVTCTVSNYFDGIVREYRGARTGHPAAMLSMTGIGSSERTRSMYFPNGYSSSRGARPHLVPWWGVFDREAGSIDCRDGGLLAWSGPLPVSSSAGVAGEERSITWSGCTAGEERRDGSIRVRRDPLPDGRDALSIAYDGLDVTLGEDGFHIVGTDTWPNGAGCDFANPMHSYLLVESNRADSSILAENLSTTVIGVYGDGSPCMADGLYGNHVRGRLLHAAHGAVEVDTPTHLAHVSMNERYDVPVHVEPYAEAGQPRSGEFRGHLVMKGAAGSELALIYRSWTRFADAAGIGDYTLPEQEIARLEVHSGHRPPEVFRFAFDDVWAGVLNDVADADGDGAPAVWERLHGLDPGDGGDASLDPDGDGASSAEESRRASDPHAAEPLLAESDESIVFDVERSPGSVRRLFAGRYYASEVSYDDLRDSVTVSIPRGIPELRPNRHVLTITIGGEPRFLSGEADAYSVGSGRSIAGRTCDLSGDGRTIRCDLPAQHRCSSFSSRSGYENCSWGGLALMTFAVTDTSGEAHTLTARVEAGPLDTNPTNDIVVVERPALP